MDITKLKPDFEILNKYFDYGTYDIRKYYYSIKKNKKGNSYEIIQAEYDKIFKQYNYKGMFLEPMNNIKALFEEYHIIEHLDNLIFESILFLETNIRYSIFENERPQDEEDNFQLNLMKVLVKYGMVKDLYLDETCALKLTFIKKNKTESFLIDESWYYVLINDILNSIREGLVKQKDSLFSSDLFPDYNFPQDKAKQLKFINESLIPKKKGTKNKNFIFAKYIISLVNYLNNETPFKAKEKKLISDKHSIFIYDFINYLMPTTTYDNKVIDRDEMENFNEDKKIFIRSVVSNYYKKGLK